MIFSNDKISIRQVVSLLIMDIFGTSIIILPQKSVELANQNGWIIILLTSILAIVATILITTLCQREQDLNFYQHTKKNLGTPLAYLIMIVFVIKNILIISYELSVFTSMTSQVLLPTRGLMVIYTSMILVSAYCAMQGIEARARLSEILVILLLASFVLSLIVVSIDADFKNILPVQIHSDEPYLKQSLSLIFIFMGLDYLYVLYPYVVDKTSYRKGSILAVSILGILMVVVTIIAIANYNYVTLKEQRWPIIDMISEVNMLGAYFERQDALVMSFWIMGVFSSVTAGLYYSAVIVMDLIPKAKTKYVITAMAIIVFIATDLFMGVGINETIILNIIIVLMIFFLFVFPILSLIIGSIKGWFSNRDSSKTNSSKQDVKLENS